MLGSIHESVSAEVIEEGKLDLSQNSEKIEKLSAKLLEEVVWQKRAKQVLENILEEIIAWVSIRKAGYNKPMASMIFAWPSWVWKTLLARVTQEILNKQYSNSIELIKVNCADFSWEAGYGLTRLVWASAWYIGSDKKPQFHPDNIEWKWRVILLDEIEKAWPTFWNMLLSILDDWTLDVNYTKPKPTEPQTAGNINYSSWSFVEKKVLEEDSYLRTYFKDSIIIMTSNVWNDRINKEVSNRWIWFTTSETKIKDLDVEWIILEEFWKQFKIEMQWRFDYVVPFNHLTEQDAILIISQLINRVVSSTLEQWNGFVIEFSEWAKLFILNEIVKWEEFRKYGWRHIEKYFKKNILPYVARAINSWEINKWDINHSLLVDEKNTKLFFSKIPVIKQKDIPTVEKVDKILSPS